MHDTESVPSSSAANPSRVESQEVVNNSWIIWHIRVFMVKCGQLWFYIWMIQCLLRSGTVTDFSPRYFVFERQSWFAALRLQMIPLSLKFLMLALCWDLIIFGKVKDFIARAHCVIILDLTNTPKVPRNSTKIHHFEKRRLINNTSCNCDQR